MSWLLLALACTPADLKPVGSDLGETDPPTADTSAPASRPLCDASAAMVPPTIAADLVAWERSLHASDNRFFGMARLQELDALGDVPGATPEAIVTNRIDRGWHRMKFGRIDEAILDLTAARDQAAAEVTAWLPRARQVLAVAWMRKAELDNCVTDGTGAACLVPFSEAALHQQEEGMTHAAAELTAFLTEDDPTHVGARWLLNIAHMALGDWPDALPPALAVPPDLLQAEAPFPEWPNVSPAYGRGLLPPTISGGAAIEDFDGDGLLDLLASNFAPDQGMTLLLNTGDGGLCDASYASGVSAIPGVLQFTPGDYDNDGDIDVIAPRAAWQDAEGHVRLSLLRNDGGRFTDVAVAAGMADAVGASQVALWSDVDGDGWLDAFVGRERWSTLPDDFAPTSMYINNRDGTFTDVAAPMGLGALGWVKGASFGDFDNDGDPDLYVSILGGPNRLFINHRDEGRFSQAPPLKALQVAAPFQAFSSFFLDYDQDGWLDLFAAAYPTEYNSNGPLTEVWGSSAEAYARDLLGISEAETAHLYRNDGRDFIDVTAAAGIDDAHATMGSAFGDMNADGFPDLYLGTGAPDYDALEPNVAYLNDGGKRFLDVTAAAHVGHLQKGHGNAFGDLDEDGDEDLYAEIGGAFEGDAFPNALFEHPGADAHSVTLRLHGVESNRSAIGARVRVVTATRTWHHVVGLQSSFGNSSLQIEAAIGAESAIARVEIDWPSGLYEEVRDVEIGTIVDVREGDGVVAARDRTPLTLRRPKGDDH